MFTFIQTLSLPLLFIAVAVSMYIVVKAADYFVRGAGSISQTFGVSTFIVGLTVVAIGTSAPEMFVNIIAAHSGATDLSIGNILGSNIANILLALGIAALFVPLTIKSQTVWKEVPYSLLAGVMVFILGADALINHAGISIITRSEGLVLLAFFIIFLVYTFGLSKMQDDTKEEEKMDIFPLSHSIAFVLGGLGGLVLGGKLVVESAVAIASIAGLSQNLIGLTVVAIGTSLPEIVTSVIAVRKGFVDMVIGGVIGSNIFNIFLVLALTSITAPLPFSNSNIIDALFLMFISIVLFFAMFVGKRHTLERWQGGVFLILYIAYIIFAIWRG